MAAATWPEATLTFTDAPKSDRTRTRSWRDVPGNELNFQSSIDRTQIAVSGNRATAYVAISGRWYRALDDIGERAVIYDYHVLQRRNGKWAISSTSRRVLRFHHAKAARRFESSDR